MGDYESGDFPFFFFFVSDYAEWVALDSTHLNLIPKGESIRYNLTLQFNHINSKITAENRISPGTRIRKILSRVQRGPFK